MSPTVYKSCLIVYPDFIKQSESVNHVTQTFLNLTDL